MNSIWSGRLRKNAVIITHNRVDFQNLARQWWQQSREHAGIILAVRRASTHDLLRHVLPCYRFTIRLVGTTSSCMPDPFRPPNRVRSAGPGTMVSDVVSCDQGNRPGVSDGGGPRIRRCFVFVTWRSFANGHPHAGRIEIQDASDGPTPPTIGYCLHPNLSVSQDADSITARAGNIHVSIRNNLFQGNVVDVAVAPRCYFERAARRILYSASEASGEATTEIAWQFE